jgi:hypothetical protein
MYTELFIGAEMELTMHDGTVRDLVFMEDMGNRTSLLISGGAGNCHIHLTDCVSGQTFRSLTGHTGLCIMVYVMVKRYVHFQHLYLVCIRGTQRKFVYLNNI